VLMQHIGLHIQGIDCLFEFGSFLLHKCFS